MGSKIGVDTVETGHLNLGQKPADRSSTARFSLAASSSQYAGRWGLAIEQRRSALARGFLAGDTSSGSLALRTHRLFSRRVGNGLSEDDDSKANVGTCRYVAFKMTRVTLELLTFEMTVPGTANVRRFRLSGAAAAWAAGGVSVDEQWFGAPVPERFCWAEAWAACGPDDDRRF